MTFLLQHLIVKTSFDINIYNHQVLIAQGLGWRNWSRFREGKKWCSVVEDELRALMRFLCFDPYDGFQLTLSSFLIFDTSNLLWQTLHALQPALIFRDFQPLNLETAGILSPFVRYIISLGLELFRRWHI